MLIWNRHSFVATGLQLIEQTVVQVQGGHSCPCFTAGVCRRDDHASEFFLATHQQYPMEGWIACNAEGDDQCIRCLLVSEAPGTYKALLFIDHSWDKTAY